MDEHISLEAILAGGEWADDVRCKGVGPERRLMLAVLQDALLTLGSRSQARTARAHRMVAEVETWVASDARSHPFAFATICDVLGFDPDYVRRRIREWRLELASRPAYRRTYAGRSRHHVTVALEPGGRRTP